MVVVTAEAAAIIGIKAKRIVVLNIILFVCLFRLLKEVFVGLVVFGFYMKSNFMS
jgi:hypothetical protein